MADLTAIAQRKTDIIEAYRKEMATFLRALNRMESLRVSLIRLGTIQDSDLVGPNSFLTAVQFNLAVTRESQMVTVLTAGGTVPAAVRDAFEDVVSGASTI